MKKSVQVILEMDRDGALTVEIPACNDVVYRKIEAWYSPDEHPEFDESIGAALYSCLKEMAAEDDASNPAAKFNIEIIWDQEPTDVELTIRWHDTEQDLFIERTATAAAWFSDWLGECELCPANDTPLTKVTVSTYNGKAGEMVFVKNDSQNGSTFEDLMEAIRPTMVYHHWGDTDEDYIWCGEPDTGEEPKYFLGTAAARRYIEKYDVPFAMPVECVGICPHCGQPVFPSREPGVWGYCHHCDACYAGPEDISSEG